MKKIKRKTFIIWTRILLSYSSANGLIPIEKRKKKVEKNIISITINYEWYKDEPYNYQL